MAITMVFTMEPVTPQALSRVRFRIARRGQRYDAAEVDDFLDRVSGMLQRGEDPAPLAEQASLAGARRFGEGYDASEVDDLMYRIARRAFPAGGSASGGPLRPDGRIQPLAEEPGLFAKLFGRRR